MSEHPGAPGLARAAHLPELSHRHRAAQLGRDPIYVRLRCKRTPARAADATFATTPDRPGPGLSLFRFSQGHGGLACESCHGSTHAELPSTHANDNVQSLALQGHAGPLADCGTCHASVSSRAGVGPHGMHATGASWVRDHTDAAEHGGRESCRACHGADYRGTELSEALGDRVLSTEFGSKTFFRGARIGCYACHNGPSSEGRTSNRPPVATSASAVTRIATPVSLALSASDPNQNPLKFRIISQPEHGTVGLNGSSARYFPEAGFEGVDHFTWSAWDGSIDSNLATGTITVSTNPPQAGAPTVSAVHAGKPFSITVTGTSFDPAVRITISGMPWTQLTWRSATSVTLTGKKQLKARFPKKGFVPIQLTNPDGQSVSVSFNRKSNAWR